MDWWGLLGVAQHLRVSGPPRTSEDKPKGNPTRIRHTKLQHLCPLLAVSFLRMWTPQRKETLPLPLAFWLCLFLEFGTPQVNATFALCFLLGFGTPPTTTKTLPLPSAFSWDLEPPNTNSTFAVCFLAVSFLRIWIPPQRKKHAIRNPLPSAFWVCFFLGFGP